MLVKISCYAETEIICERQYEVIDCGVDLISISSSIYGRTDTNTCGESSYTNCVLDVAHELDYCNGQTQCSVQALNYPFGDPCQGVQKYLNITYTCEGNSYHGLEVPLFLKQFLP